MTTTSHRNYLRTPTEMVRELTVLHEMVQRQTELTSLTFGVPEIDAKLRTLWGGTLTTIVSRPSHLKSFSLKHMAKVRMAELIHHERLDRVVMYLTLEESHKRVYMELTGFADSYLSVMRREYDEQRFMDETIAGSHVSAPLWMITDQPAQRPGSLQSAPRFTVQELYREIDQAVSDFGGRKEPDCLFVDYLQLFQVDKQGDDSKRIFTVMAAVDEVRRIGRLLDIPVVMAVQAHRSVDDKPVPIPGMRNAEWASAIEQYSDVMLATAVPARWPYAKIREGVELAGDVWSAQELLEDVAVVTLLKQRMYEGVGQWVVRIDYDGGLLLPLTRQLLDEGFAL